MKKTLLLVSFFALVLSTRVFAQAEGSSYSTAIGVKFWPGAISVKHFVADDRALEGLFNFWDGGFRFTGLYEIHGDVGGAEGLKWYVGPGAHIGWYNGYAYHDYYYNSGALSIGLDGVLGLEYKFQGAPIAVSADILPYLEFNHAYLGIWGGIGVKYTW
ncbi:MAG TPA: hypothetical protein VNU70_06250 [Puia sp.]|nr:hypothetical protein [Puia sp.]